MRRINPRRPVTPIDVARLQAQSVLEPTTAEPNILRDAVLNAVSSLSVTERVEFCNLLLAELRKAGLKVRQSLLMLGVSARTSDELTAPEIASLVRYVRISEPNVLTAVAASIRGLFASLSRGAAAGVVGGKAA